MISVIIPTADRPSDYLRKAIESAQSQTLPPGEIIVVDNGVRPAVIEGLPAPVALVRLAPRAGPSRARNAGAARAKGTHLAFLDDDDWWEPGFLAEVARVAASGGYRIVYGRKDKSFDGVTVSPGKAPLPEAMNLNVMMRRNPCTGGQNLYIEARLFAEIGGFDERMRYAEDRALAVEALLAGEIIGCAPNAVAVLRQHNGHRLRHHPGRRARFVWKYRRLLPAREVAVELLRIAGTSLRGLLRGKPRVK